MMNQSNIFSISIKRVIITCLGLILLIILVFIAPTERRSSSNMVKAVMDSQQQTPSPLKEKAWLRTGGPIGGLGYDVRVHPENPDIMYVTDALSGISKSEDGGYNWQPINSGIDSRTGLSGDAIPVFSATIDPNNPDILWVGLIDMSGIYRSPDGGLTWEKRINGIVEEHSLSIRGFAVEPGNSNVVYAAGEVGSWWWAGQAMNGKEFDRVQGVVYKSIDSGLTWNAVWRGDNLARYVLFDPNDTNIIYVSTGIFDREAANSDPTTNSPGGVGIIKSSDGGQTWTQKNNGLNNFYIGSLFMHPQNSQILLAGAGNFTYFEGGGIYLTENGGEKWMYVGGENIQSVEFSVKDPSVAYAAGAYEFHWSLDGGYTWQNLGNWGPQGIHPGIPIDFQVDPRDSQRVFVNNYGGGNFLSEDGGLSWQTASAGYTGATIKDVSINTQLPSLVYVTSRSGPFLSADGGLNWKGIDPPSSPDIESVGEGARIAVDPHNPAHILMSSAQFGRTYESKDSGHTWKEVSDFWEELTNLPWPDPNQKSQGFQAITFAPSGQGKVYAGFGINSCADQADGDACSTPPIASILTSNDGGTSWTRHEGTALDGLTVTEIAVHPSNGDFAWAATAGGGVFVTNNGGDTWFSRSDGLGSLRVVGLAVDLSNANILFAGTSDSGVFRSEDGGLSWTSSSIGMDPNEPIDAIVIDPVRPNIIYAGSWISGVFLSEDSGKTWSLINQGLRTRSIRSLAISADGTVLYSGTRGEGVFRLGEISTANIYLPMVISGQ